MLLIEIFLHGIYYICGVNIKKMRYKFLFCLLFIVNLLNAQNVGEYPKYPYPMKIPVFLSATFGELRNNAFHAGLDIKTKGEIGYRVYAVADGYVSRIAVSPFGYGNVVYVTHNDGYMSVYAHLEKFNEKIGKYVKQKQLESKSFAQNLFLEKGEITVKTGDILGLSGNTGGSGGPHLHFELRDAKQRPINPYLFGITVKDNIKPTIQGIAVYPKENSSINGSESPAYFGIEDNMVIKANGKLYFGVSAYDKADGSHNKNGVNSIELYADKRLVFSILFNQYSYDETRYINSLIDYKKYYDDNVRYVRTEVDEYNILDLYGEKSGYITVKEGDNIEMEYVVKDFYNNVSKCKFTIVGERPLEEYMGNQYGRSYYRVDGNDVAFVNLDGFSAEIPKKAFYKFEYILAQQTEPVGNIASDYVYVFGTEDIPVQKKINVKIRPSERFSSSEKLYVISIDKDGKFIPQGGQMKDGMVETKVRALGKYALAEDNKAPSVIPDNFKNNSKVIKCKRLNVKIKDDESGIDKYNIYLNGKWVVGAYDAKNDLLFYDVDEFLKKGNNKMEIVVTDCVGNETRKTYNIIREFPKK